jgi:hypothetical protein
MRNKENAMNNQPVPPAPVHEHGTARGEEAIRERGPEPGRIDSGRARDGSPTGKSTARFSTGINPDARRSIVPNSPYLPPA